MWKIQEITAVEVLLKRILEKNYLLCLKHYSTYIFLAGGGEAKNKDFCILFSPFISLNRNYT